MANELEAFLKKNQVPDGVIAYFTGAETEGKLGLSSISDFASAFTEGSFEKDCETHVKKAGNESIVAVSRARTACLKF